MSGELSGCVIVSGIPAAGKSTVTALAASLLPRAAQVKGDAVNQMILSGRLSPRPVRLVTLAPGVDVCRQRNATRAPEERFEFDGYHQLEAGMRRDLGEVGWWFDTSALTPTQSAEQVVREIAQRAAPVHGGWHAQLEQLDE